jgi:tRNA A-37 threonylcarbamoyl transferase component Bud32
MVFLSYFYWTFASYRTARVMVDVHKATNVNPLAVLNMAPMPVYAILVFFLILIPIRLSNLPPTFFVFPLLGWALLLIIYATYQWKWPISASITVRAIEKQHGAEARIPAWLEHFGTAFLFNLTPVLYLAVFANSLTSSRLFETLFPYATNAPALGSATFALVFVCAQYLGLFLLKLRITKAALMDRDFRIYSERAKNNPPKVSDDDIIVRYRAFADWERWFKHRMKERSNKKLIFLIATVAVFFLIGAPQWCLDNLTQVPGVATAAAGAAQAGPTINFLNIFQAFLTGVFGLGGLIYVVKPTHIGFSARGVRYLWRHSIIDVNGDYIKWSAFHKIRLFLPKGKTSPADQCLLFDAGGGNGTERDIRIKLSSVIQVDDRERILKAIERYAPGVERDASVLQVLQRPADHSYTELWLQALSAPPKRERFKPLADGASLQDRRFEILGQLGVGGQGTAYLANDMHEKKTVVLKEFILPVYVDVTVRRQALERFENEARILKQLEHDQIVKLLDFFVEDHRSYLVLEHIEGKSLKQIVDEQGPLSEKQVIGLATQMCTMLEYLHGLEPPVVHRDFTPDNLILRTDGKLKLVDFNVAQQTDSTATGTVVGKHAYLPPEQFRGTPVPQSDLYSLGATLHYLLTGCEPEPISVSHPKRIKETVSENMDLFVARATAMSLEARHRNVEELRAELNDFFDGSGD